MKGIEVRNKEISWLAFNARLLQEADDDTVPLIERIKFLGIYSSNMDEFFKVRIATLQELVRFGKAAEDVIYHDPDTILQDIEKIVLDQRVRFGRIYHNILDALVEQKIFIINEKELNVKQQVYVSDYFHKTVHSRLFPVILTHKIKKIDLRDNSIYLSVSLSKKGKKGKVALIEIPTYVISRFVILPQYEDKKYIILLDDVIRYNLNSIFSMFDYDDYKAYTIKLTRNSEMDIDNDLSESMLKKISKGLRKRKEANPVRLEYDKAIPRETLAIVTKRLSVNSSSSLIPGGRYHNFRDFIGFPDIGTSKLKYKKMVPVPHRYLEGKRSLFPVLRKRDILLYFPFNPFDYVITLLREASIDPKVESISITVYRVAKQSSIMNALVNAVKNGKDVTVVLELKARFDEKANVKWATILRDEGVTVTYGIPQLKVHAKLILIKRKQGREFVYFSGIGTGNFNEDTARIYTDHLLLTSNPGLTGDVKKVFDFLLSSYKVRKYQNLFVSPFDSRVEIISMIDNEIRNAREGKKAGLIFKLNNLVDYKIISRLYKAASRGVSVRLMIRGMFSLVPGIKGLSSNIKAKAIIDRYLEHSRIFIFLNKGKQRVFLSSADFMSRNFERRVEVICPVYDEEIKKELIDILEIQWQDNCKSRILDQNLNNEYDKTKVNGALRSQVRTYGYLRKLNSPSAAVNE